jgi:transcription elongation factor SPT5
MSDSEIELFSEDDPEVEKRPKKKQRRAANIFIEDQARVDDSEDDESDDEAEEGFEQGIRY